jgi:hypothetical protein
MMSPQVAVRLRFFLRARAAETRANRRIYRTLIEPLERHHRRSLDKLLNVAPHMIK